MVQINKNHNGGAGDWEGTAEAELPGVGDLVEENLAGIERSTPNIHQYGDSGVTIKVKGGVVLRALVSSV